MADTLAYVLLGNHFHFLVRTKNESDLSSVLEIKDLNIGDHSLLISRAFSNLFNAYSKSINKAYNRTGSLFQERFRRKEIESDSYFTEVIFYIHGNPQKHGLVDDFREYTYSSITKYLRSQAGLPGRLDNCFRMKSWNGLAGEKRLFTTTTSIVRR
jgi:REP element-mobilizing transposase RayT